MWNIKTDKRYFNSNTICMDVVQDLSDIMQFFKLIMLCHLLNIKDALIYMYVRTADYEKI